MRAPISPPPRRKETTCSRLGLIAPRAAGARARTSRSRPAARWRACPPRRGGTLRLGNAAGHARRRAPAAEPAHEEHRGGAAEQRDRQELERAPVGVVDGALAALRGLVERAL